MNAVVTVLYYLMTAYIAVLLARNFLTRKNWQEEALYLIVLIPFLLRLLRLK
jgi:multisubunit Na+/H+ antiporter MnhE subunit